MSLPGHSQYYVGGGFKYFYATVAYSSVGEPLWTNLYADTGNSLALAIALDKSGNVFVTGEAVMTLAVSIMPRWHTRRGKTFVDKLV